MMNNFNQDLFPVSFSQDSYGLRPLFDRNVRPVPGIWNKQGELFTILTTKFLAARSTIKIAAVRIDVVQLRNAFQQWLDIRGMLNFHKWKCGIDKKSVQCLLLFALIGPENMQHGRSVKRRSERSRAVGYVQRSNGRNSSCRRVDP